ncbi:glycosyltransferase family 4 protein [Scandinavium sp.]|uniref:glycosyltransferase family 4 protein n=1 Tax=Scandinavium sp. TaxID=2830653 RepID=UPI00289BA6CD|nr:glycosyltransferase family 4 protein [Scandinavium sp.]
MTKIVYFIPSLYKAGGMERVLTTKINYFVDNFEDLEISIVMNSNQGRAPFYPLDPRVELVELNIDFYEGNNPLKKILGYLSRQSQYKKKVQAWLNENEADICISYFGREIDFFHKLTGDFKRIGELHFSRNYRKYIYSSISNSPIYKMLSYFRDRQLLRNVKYLDKLIVLTKADKQSWLDDGIKNVDYIYNPSPLSPRLRANIESKRVVAIGRLVEQKGFDSLLRIWSRVAETFPDWSLTIYGEGPLATELESQIRTNGIFNVHIKPFVSDIEKIYENASIIASSSNFEGLPMVLIEAQSSGVPCIAYDCPCGPVEIIESNKNGYVVELRNENLYAEKLKSMLSNKYLLVEFSEQALKSSLQYSIENISARWMKLFQEVKYGN